MSSTLIPTEPTPELQPKLDDLLPKLQQLEQMLEADNPDIADFMKYINDDLRQYPELTYLLNDDQLSVIYRTVLKSTDTHLAVKKSKSRGKKGLLPDGQDPADLL